MKTVLILGCGYVGRAVAASERAQGNRVLAVTRNEAMAAQLRAGGVEVFVGNVHEASWHAFAREIDWVVNCVSAASPDLEGYRISYVEGNRSLGEWMVVSGFNNKAVYTSSVSVYPDSGGNWVDESEARVCSERSEILLESEQVFLESHTGAAKTVLRLGGIYGPGRSFLADRIAKAEGALPGYGDYYLNLIRLEDIVGAIGAVCRSELSRSAVYNVVDDAPLLREELVEGLAKAMKLPVLVFDPSIKRAKGSRRLGGERPANRRISNRCFKEAFGWRPHFPSALAGMVDLISS